MEVDDSKLVSINVQWRSEGIRQVRSKWDKRLGNIQTKWLHGRAPRKDSSEILGRFVYGYLVSKWLADARCTGELGDAYGLMLGRMQANWRSTRYQPVG
jgi:hypothetical protein